MGKILPISRKKELTPEEIEEAKANPYPEDSQRPRDMDVADCCYPDAPRPCPLVSCEFNNYLTVTDNGTILLTWPGKEPHEVDPKRSCLNDMYNAGQDINEPMTLEEIGDNLGGITRERVRQILETAQAKGKEVLDEGNEDDDA